MNDYYHNLFASYLLRFPAFILFEEKCIYINNEKKSSQEKNRYQSHLLLQWKHTRKRQPLPRICWNPQQCWWSQIKTNRLHFDHSWWLGLLPFPSQIKNLKSTDSNKQKDQNVGRFGRLHIFWVRKCLRVHQGTYQQNQHFCALSDGHLSLFFASDSIFDAGERMGKIVDQTICQVKTIIHLTERQILEITISLGRPCQKST